MTASHWTSRKSKAAAAAGYYMLKNMQTVL